MLSTRNSPHLYDQQAAPRVDSLSIVTLSQWFRAYIRPALASCVRLKHLATLTPTHGQCDFYTIRTTVGVRTERTWDLGHSVQLRLHTVYLCVVGYPSEHPS